MQRFLARIESHQHDQTTIFKVIHIEYILINKAMYFIFKIWLCCVITIPNSLNFDFPARLVVTLAIWRYNSYLIINESLMTI